MGRSHVTLKQISDACGLSLSTVSAALNNADERYNAKTVEYVRDVARQLGYRANQQAQILKGASSGLIGIIKNISLHQITAEFAIYAGKAIQAAGYRLFSSDIFLGSGTEGLIRSLDVMMDARVEGILIEDQKFSEGAGKAIADAMRNKVPVVLIEGYPFDGVPYVGADHYKGFCRIASHLVACGYRSIALAVSENDFASLKKDFTVKGASNWRINEAVRAVNHVASKHGIKAELMAMPPSDAEPADLEEIYFASSRRFIQNLAGSATRPRAVVFSNDLFAVAALRACADEGLRVPEDIAITGCDGSAIGRHVIPRLTSIAIPTPDIAKEAVRLLTDLIQNKISIDAAPQILLPPTVAIHESCSIRRNQVGSSGVLSPFSNI